MSAKGEAGPLVGGKITDYYDFPFFFFIYFFILGTKLLQPRYYNVGTVDHHGDNSLISCPASQRLG